MFECSANAGARTCGERGDNAFIINFFHRGFLARRDQLGSSLKKKKKKSLLDVAIVETTLNYFPSSSPTSVLSRQGPSIGCDTGRLALTQQRLRQPITHFSLVRPAHGRGPRLSAAIPLNE